MHVFSFEDGCDIRRIQKLLGHVRLETTTIYVKVAKPVDDLGTSSPLDKIYQAPGSELAKKAVGRLSLHFQTQTDQQVSRAAKVTIEVSNPDRPIYFTGTYAREVRAGFVTLEISPLEDWAEPLAWLTRDQRERFEEPEFYEMLRGEITRRFLALPLPAG